MRKKVTKNQNINNCKNMMIEKHVNDINEVKNDEELLLIFILRCMILTTFYQIYFKIKSMININKVKQKKKQIKKKKKRR